MQKQPLQQNFRKTRLATTDAEIICDSEKYPNRLICVVRLKLKNEEGQKIIGNWGTGCFLNEKYVLTAAHVVIALLQRIEKDKKIELEGYVRQALNDGKFIGTYRIKLESIKISKAFLNNDRAHYKDYALFEVEPIDQVQPEKQYMPLIAFKKEVDNLVQQISLYGYFYDLNKGSNTQIDSSIFMQNLYGSKGEDFNLKPKQITYDLPTERGVSGGPIIAYSQAFKEHIIIGIHKGKEVRIKKNNSKEQNQNQNCGIIASEMLEEMNKWGYQLIKEPFIYTRQTYFLRNNPQLKKIEVLNLLDKYLDAIDMKVLTAFDLSHIKKIILSGNKLKETGVVYLLKQKYPHLESLHLTQNQITSLNSVAKDEWNNISTISTLSLSVNSLKQLPESMLSLQNLHTFNICFNDFETIPSIISSLNGSKGQKVKVLIYENKFKAKDPKVQEVKTELMKKDIVLYLNRDDL